MTTTVSSSLAKGVAAATLAVGLWGAAAAPVNADPNNTNGAQQPGVSASPPAPPDPGNPNARDRIDRRAPSHRAAKSVPVVCWSLSNCQ
jgi:hypothetical protein